MPGSSCGTGVGDGAAVGVGVSVGSATTVCVGSVVGVEMTVGKGVELPKAFVGVGETTVGVDVGAENESRRLFSVTTVIQVAVIDGTVT